MGIFLQLSIFSTLCLIQAAFWNNFTRDSPSQDVTFMKSGTEYTRITDSSPTGVFRALKDIHLQLQMHPECIVSEKLFEHVVTTWIHQWKDISKIAMDIDYEINDYEFIDQDNSSRTVIIREYRIAKFVSFENTKNSRIVLLTPEKLKPWTNTSQTHNWDITGGSHVDIIVGSCLQKFFINQPGIVMMNHVQTRYWIYPRDSKHKSRHWVQRHNVPYLVQHTGKSIWWATSLQSQMDFCHKKRQTQNLYGSLQHFSIGLVEWSNVHVLQDAIQKTWKRERLRETFFEHVAGYLKLKWYWVNFPRDSDIPNVKNFAHNWPPDFPTIDSDLHADDGTKKWPPLYRDGVTALSQMKSRDMTLSRLVSILKVRVWIATIVILLLFNLAFFFLFDASPSLRNNPKIKYKSMSKVMRILFFDSLIRFQGDWQAGPTKPTRILLLFLNIFIFIILTAFLAVFSVQILSRRYFPLNSLTDVCNKQSQVYMDIDLLSALEILRTFSHQCYVKIINDSIRNIARESEDHIGCLRKDSCSVLTYYKKGSLATNGDPDLFILQKPESVAEMSFRFGTGAVFKNSFTLLTLRLREVGILQILQARDFDMIRKEFFTEEAIKFSETWLTISMLAIGLFAAVIIMIAEKIL